MDHSSIAVQRPLEAASYMSVKGVRRPDPEEAAVDGGIPHLANAAALEKCVASVGLSHVFASIRRRTAQSASVISSSSSWSEMEGWNLFRRSISPLCGLLYRLVNLHRMSHQCESGSVIMFS